MLSDNVFLDPVAPSGFVGFFCFLKGRNCTDFSYHLVFSVAYATDDVTYVWRHENPVEMPTDMRLSQFDLMETPSNYSSITFLKGGIVVDQLANQHSVSLCDLAPLV